MVGVFYFIFALKNCFKFSSDHKELLFLESEMPTPEHCCPSVCKVCRCGLPGLPHAAFLKSQLFQAPCYIPLLGLVNREHKSELMSCTVISNTFSFCIPWIEIFKLVSSK